MIRETKSRLGWTAWFELGAVLTIAPFLLFPRLPLTAWLLPAIPAIWLMRCATRTVGRTPLGKPLLLMLIAAAVGFLASYDQHVSFDKLAGILLGVAIYHALVHWATSPRTVVWATAGLVIGGSVVALISLVGTNWAAYKFPFLQPVYSNLPVLLRGVPRAEGGFSPNEVGGTLTLFVPLIVGLLFYSVPVLGGRCRRWIVGAALALACLLTVGVLLLAQSRLAIASTLLALVVLGLLGGRRARIVAFTLMILCLVAILIVGPDGLVRWFFHVNDLGEFADEVSLAGRIEIWNRSVRALLDHPFTGVGLDTLPAVINARYPLFLYPRGYYFTHAHNIYLQVALDLGVLGLIGYTWMLIAVFGRLWRVYALYPTTQSSFAWEKALAVSLLSGLLAYQLYGLADAITLGAKPGVFWWMLLAISQALGARPLPRARHSPIRAG
jgi:putative inorganic carbon (HCO3(-)) transporter